MTSLRLKLKDGAIMAYQEWGRGGLKKVIASHGWMDNSNTHSILGPYLASQGFHVIAIDWIGHGHSSHLPNGAPYLFQKSVFHLRDALEQLGWTGGRGSGSDDVVQKVHVVGHSMGAAISVLFVGSYPELVDKFVAIENFGQFTRPAATAAQNLRRAVDAEFEKYKRISSILSKLDEKLEDSNLAKILNRPYPSAADAVAARIKTVSRYEGGKQTLSVAAATALVSRGIEIISPDKGAVDVAVPSIDNESGSSNALNTVGHVTDMSKGPVRFLHDPNLLMPSYVYSTSDQVMSSVASITSKTLLVTGDNGWPFPTDPEDFMSPRLKLLKDKGLLIHRVIKGSHHLHLDPESADECSKIIGDFLLE